MQTSPRPQYQQMAPVNGGYNPYQGQPMSRTGSTNMAHMEIPGRPTSSMGQMPTPTHTPQPILVPPPNPVTPGPGPGSPFTRPKSQAIPILNPSTRVKVRIEKSQASPVVVTSAPVIVSSGPSPAPGRAMSRNTVHSRSASTSGKTEQEKREEMKATVAKKLEEERIEEARKKEEEEREKERIEAEKKAAEEKLRLEKEEEQKAKEEAERKLKEEAEEKARKEAEEEIARLAEDMRVKKEAEEAAEAEAEAARLAAEKAAEKAAEEAAEQARIATEKAEEAARIEAAEKAQKLREEEEAKAKAEAEAKAVEEEAAQKAALAAASIAKPSPPDTEPMPPPPVKALEKPRPRPGPLDLRVKTNEPGPPSAALTALRSARFIDNFGSINYPANILSPNPALNPAANCGFKYEKDFLLQFQTVFTEKPTVDWDKTMKDTVGEPDSARPQTARTPGLGPRGSSRSGGSSAPPPMGAFGSFKPSLPANMLTSEQRFQQSRSASLPVANPLAGMVGSFSSARSGGVSIMRTNSSSSLAGGMPQSPRTGNRSSRGGSRKGGGTPMEKSESRQGDKLGQPTILVSDIKPLPVSENRWKPRSVGTAKGPEAAPTPSEEVKLSPELVQRKVKAALNKMTPEKFDKISDQILEITTQSKFETDGLTLRQVIQLTFEKATDEAAWSSMYAKFCKRMEASMDPNIKDEGIRDNKTGQIVTGGHLFRKYLLNRCQEEFERGWKVNLPPKPEGTPDEAVMLSDEYYVAAAAKRRGLGLIQFIGELFKLGMLTERIMNECVRKLLDFEGLPEDETVESLCKLLKTIGYQLDTSEKSKSMMDMYFHRIGRMSDDKDLNSRMRFMLMVCSTLPIHRKEKKKLTFCRILLISVARSGRPRSPTRAPRLFRKLERMRLKLNKRRKLPRVPTTNADLGAAVVVGVATIAHSPKALVAQCIHLIGKTRTKEGPSMPRISAS